MRKFAGILIAIIAIIGLKFWRSSNDSKEVLAQAKELISEMPEYPQNAAYLDKLVDLHHTLAFNAAYDMGGRRRRASFNEKKYVHGLLTRMAESCRTDGKSELWKALQEADVAIQTAASPPPT
jgi:hypothetical protein